jgi:hypothetical protein
MTYCAMSVWRYLDARDGDDGMHGKECEGVKDRKDTKERMCDNGLPRLHHPRNQRPNGFMYTEHGPNPQDSF